MYEEHFGFSRKPFGINPDPAFLYLNGNYREAIALLQYGIQEKKGIVSLIGEVGTGKTMLLNLLLASLGPEAQTVAVPPVRFDYEGLISFLLDKVEAPGRERNGTSTFDELFSALRTKADKHEAVILLVDEAQDFDDETLESIRLLSNFETPTRKLLQILLVGQPELLVKLGQPALRQLKQRVAVTYILQPLSAEETPSYIAHRLKSAGYANGTNLFAPDALKLVSTFSQGIPRLVNALCDNALLNGYAANKRWIDAGMVREAANDLMLSPLADRRATPTEDKPAPGAKPATHPPPVPTDSRGSRFPLKLVAVIAILALMLAALFAGPLLESAPQEWRQRLNAIVDSALSNRSASDPSPAEAIDVQTKMMPESAVDRPLAAPQAAVMRPAPAPLSPEASPEASPEPAVFDAEGDADRPAATAVQPGLGVSSDETQDDSSRPETTDRGQTARPDAAKPDAAAATRNATDAQPSAQPRLMQDERDRRGDLGESSSSQPAPLVPAQLDVPGQEAVAFAASAARPSTAQPDDPRDTAASAVEPIDQANPRRPAFAESGQVQTTNVETTAPLAVVTIQRGDTITQIASSVYGDAGIYELAAIRIANPEIRNLNVVDLGRQVVIPDLRSGLLLSSDADGGARVLLDATRSLATAEAMQAMLARDGLSTEIVTDKLSDTITAYRLESRFSPNGPPTAETLDQLSTLRLKLVDYGE